MSDKFIKKADNSKDFNNGGIVYNATGGGDDFPNGPDNNLSESNQQKKLMNLKEDLHPEPSLPPHYRTWEEYWATEPDLGPSATINNHGQVDSGGYGTSYTHVDGEPFYGNEGPCPDGSPRNKNVPPPNANKNGCCGAQTKALITFEDIFRKSLTYTNNSDVAQNDAQKFLDDMKDETTLAGVSMIPRNFSGPGFDPNSKFNYKLDPRSGSPLVILNLFRLAMNPEHATCDCWKPLIGISDLFGGMVAGKAALKFVHLLKGAVNFKKLFGGAIRRYCKKLGMRVNGVSDDMAAHWAANYMRTGSPGSPETVTMKIPVTDVITGEVLSIDVNMYHQFGHVFKMITGTTITAFFQLSIKVPKRCYGSNAVLNWKTCECECPPDHDECSPTNLGSGVDASWLYDLIVPNFVPTANELKACRYCDCDLKVGDSITSTIVYGGWNTCMCDSCIDGTTFKEGAGCSCYKEFNRPPLPAGVNPGDYTPGIGKQRGKCVDNDIITVETALGKSWDGQKCAYVCPAGTDVHEDSCGSHPCWGAPLGASPRCGDLARLQDNLGTTAPSKHHYLYRTGCNCVCDGRDYEGSWPPTCASDELFSTNKYVCGCRKKGVCKEYAMTGSGETFQGPNKLADAIAYINASCTGVGTYGYYYTDAYGDIVAEVANRDLTDNGEGPIGYDTITGYSAAVDCSDTLGPEFTVICGSVQGGHNYTWTECPDDGSPCPLTLSDEAFNYTYP